MASAKNEILTERLVCGIFLETNDLCSKAKNVRHKLKIAF